MAELALDGSSWASVDDVYDALLPALGAPAWHGRNLDALADTLSGGDINQVNAPVRVWISGTQSMGAAARQLVLRLVHLAADLRADGIEVYVEPDAGDHRDQPT